MCLGLSIINGVEQSSSLEISEAAHATDIAFLDEKLTISSVRTAIFGLVVQADLSLKPNNANFPNVIVPPADALHWQKAFYCAN